MQRHIGGSLLQEGRAPGAAPGRSSLGAPSKPRGAGRGQNRFPSRASSRGIGATTRGKGKKKQGNRVKPLSP
eukprot:5135868-Pyramimonas_sp.AAC.1